MNIADADAGAAKVSLRKIMRDRREALAPNDLLNMSFDASEHVLASAAWREARTVALYVAVRGETDTSRLLESAWQEGKRVLLPLCDRSVRGRMRMIACSGKDSLVPGAYGIPEPVCSDDDPGDALENGCCPELIIVPGVAFDRKGTRLGQGGGYYDRLLALPGFALTIRFGYAYAFQIVRHLPQDPWDLPMHALCTEQGLLWTMGK